MPENITPLLLLDSHRCHTMASVKSDIEVLGVGIQIVPGGCTAGMCQPVDADGIGKQSKVRAQPLWEEWVVSEVSNNPDGSCCHASREQTPNSNGFILQSMKSSYPIV